MEKLGKYSCTLLLVTALCFTYCASASADLVNMDLMGGFNNFEWSPAPAGSDNETAIGWEKELSPSTANGIYHLAASVFPNQGNCQYVAVKNETDQYAGAYLRFAVDLSMASCPLKAGDEVTFTVDNIKMDDFTGLPVRFRLMMDGVEGGSVIKYLTPTTSTFSDSITGTVASGTRYVRAFVQILSYNLGQHQPGIFLDGAHLYVSRGGQPLKEEIPVKSNRAIRTFKLYFSPDREDAYYIAQNYDMVNLSKDYYYWSERLRYFNPNIKIYWYQWGGGVSDRRTALAQDAGLYDEPFGFASVIQHDSDPSNTPWLYSYNPSNPTDPFLQAMIASFGSDPHNPTWKQVPYVFDFNYLDCYFVRIYLPDWQERWRADAINDVTKYHYDGVFIDDVDPKPAQTIPPDGRQVWESQSFIHGVIPQLKAAKISNMVNLCAKHLDSQNFNGDVGMICFNPWWTPSGNYTSSAGYTNNTPDNVADGFFQEWAFWCQEGTPSTYVNRYDSTYWLRCLSDMDQIDKWNASLPDNNKKQMHMQLLGSDRPEDPADGLDGWLHFGLTSYLLACNSWTSLGTNKIPTYYAPLDFSVTKKLGEPAGARTLFTSSPYALARKFNGTNSGSLGGFAAVNGNTQSTMQYKVPFDMIDETNKFVPYGTLVTLKPHTGRLFFHQNNYKYTSVVTYPAEGAIISTQTLKITGHVEANRTGLANPSTVKVKIDNGLWKNVSVMGGNFTVNWSNYTVGRHMIYTRVYLSNADYEPIKVGRSVVYQPGIVKKKIKDQTFMADAEEMTQQ